MPPGKEHSVGEHGGWSGGSTRAQNLVNVVQQKRLASGDKYFLDTERSNFARDPLYWTWFPHFSAADVEAGIYERAEALQGEARTFFSNELYAGVSVVYGVEYAHDLVRRFFA